MAKKKESKTITVRLRQENLHLVKQLQKEKIKRNRTSLSNTIEDVLLEYFKEPE